MITYSGQIIKSGEASVHGKRDTNVPPRLKSAKKRIVAGFLIFILKNDYFFELVTEEG